MSLMIVASAVLTLHSPSDRRLRTLGLPRSEVGFGFPGRLHASSSLRPHALRLPQRSTAATKEDAPRTPLELRPCHTSQSVGSNWNGGTPVPLHNRSRLRRCAGPALVCGCCDDF